MNADFVKIQKSSLVMKMHRQGVPLKDDFKGGLRTACWHAKISIRRRRRTNASPWSDALLRFSKWRWIGPFSLRKSLHIHVNRLFLFKNERFGIEPSLGNALLPIVRWRPSNNWIFCALKEEIGAAIDRICDGVLRSQSFEWDSFP